MRALTFVTGSVAVLFASGALGAGSGDGMPPKLTLAGGGGKLGTYTWTRREGDTCLRFGPYAPRLVPRRGVAVDPESAALTFRFHKRSRPRDLEIGYWRTFDRQTREPTGDREDLTPVLSRSGNGESWVAVAPVSIEPQASSYASVFAWWPDVENCPWKRQSAGWGFRINPE